MEKAQHTLLEDKNWHYVFYAKNKDDKPNILIISCARSTADVNTNFLENYGLHIKQALT